MCVDIQGVLFNKDREIACVLLMRDRPQTQHAHPRQGSSWRNPAPQHATLLVLELLLMPQGPPMAGQRLHGAVDAPAGVVCSILRGQHNGKNSQITETAV